MQSNQRADNHQNNNRNRSRGQQNSSSNNRNQTGNASNNPHHPPAPPAAEKGSGRAVSKTDGLKAILKAPASIASAPEVEKRDVGVIASIRSAFGFIQSIFSDDPIYFSEREFYNNMKVGDLLSFIVKSGPKGLAAQNVQLLSNGTDSFRVAAANVKGTVTRSYERHRSNFGLIEIEVDGLPTELKPFFQSQTNNVISFRVSDVIKESLPRNHFIDRGDYVKFSVLSVKDNVFYLAGSVELLQLKRDRAIALQIQRMLDAGAVRERGVVSAVKNQEYGFIRAQDRKDEIYFRVDDVGNEDKPQIKEGIEVEFFVIAEMIRGKLCDRAIHLNMIPTGSVQFEVIISTEVLVTVIQEPGLPPNDEVPGMAQLDEELDISKLVPNTKIKHIDLWQRCLPDDLLVRPGDRLQVSIHFYRPEKLYFARNVKVMEFFSFGRDMGTICAIKDQAFGFIRSELRKADLYFKTTQVLGFSGEKMVAESELKKGVKVSFDCSTEESSKLRAVRVQIVPDNSQQQQSAAKSGDDEKYVLRKGLLGVVTRNAIKRDAIGLIRVPPSKFKGIQEISFHDPEISIALDNFMKIPSFTTIDIPALPEFLRKSFREVISSKYTTLGLEDLATPDFHDYNSNGSGQLKSLRVWKKSSAQQLTDTLLSGNSQKGNAHATKENVKDGNPNHIQFMKDDYISEELGPLGNDMEVSFDLVYDKYRGKKVAKNIRLTDEEIIVTSADENIGIIDSIIDCSNSHKAGFIRALTSDEKIYWVAKANASTSQNPSNFVVGAAVRFDLRKRGGLRTAVSLSTLTDAPTKQETLSSICTALVVPSATNANAMEVVLVDASCEANLQYKYIDLKLLENLFASHQPNAPTATSNASAAAASAEPAAVSSPTPVKTVEEGSGEVSPVNTTASDRVEYKAKYLPALYRLPLPINEASQSSTVSNMKPGDMVTCQAVVNWTQQRGPINLVILDSLSSNTLKKRGKISKLKFRMKQMPTSPLIPTHISLNHLAHYRLNELDFTEIQEIPDKDNLSKQSEDILQINKDKNPSATFVCLFHEIMDVNASSAATAATTTSTGQSEHVVAGEEVEFYVIPTIPNIAFYVQTLPKKDVPPFSSTSKGPGINDKLKLKIAGTNLITMAQGPPTDNAQGFEAGWRRESTIAVAGLPWASLLTHLQ